MTAGGVALSAERPFPGLRPFAYADHEYFFGRNEQSGALYLMLDSSRFIAVVGNSGSGKSSLVRAGLLPLLDRERADSLVPDATGRHWRWAIAHPGDAPIRCLADAIASLSDDLEDPDATTIRAVRRERVFSVLQRSSFGINESLSELQGPADRSFLIIVDQFEEVFRYGATSTGSVGESHWREETLQFVQLLLEASRNRNHQVHILITMRSDFIGDCSQFYGLPEAVSASQYLVPSLTRDELEEAIRGPIAKAHAAIEPTLTERILNDSSNEADRLPVLQHCVSRVWTQAFGETTNDTGVTLRVIDYEAVGQVSGALSRHANQVMASLPGLEHVVELVFRSLSEVDEEGRATRRVLRFEKLLGETGAKEGDLRQVLDRFRADDCSFIVPALGAVGELQLDTRVEVGHEALLRRWDRIGAKPKEAISGSGGNSGWLMAEIRDGAAYRGLLALLDHAEPGQKTTLPLAQVNKRVQWWQSRPRTTAWAERYGGQLDRVQAILDDSVAAQRMHARKKLAIGTGICAVLALMGVLYASEWLSAESRNAHERALLLDDITSMATDTSSTLRGTPGTSGAIQEILAELNSFKARYFVWLRESKSRGAELQQTRLNATSTMLQSDQLVNAGKITAALQSLNSIGVISERSDAEEPGIGWRMAKLVTSWIPHPTTIRPDWIPVTNADIRIRRSFAERLCGKFREAQGELAAAESALLTFIQSPDTTATHDAKNLRASLIQKSWQRLAQVYMSQGDLALHYHEIDINAATAALKKLEAIVNPAGSDRDGCAELVDRSWCKQQRIFVASLAADVKMNKGDVTAAIDQYKAGLEQVEKMEAEAGRNGGRAAPWAKAYAYYRLGQALAVHTASQDAQEALRLLKVSEDYYGSMKDKEGNIWGWSMDARVERAIGFVRQELHDNELAAVALQRVVNDDGKLVERDPENEEFRKQLGEDSEKLRTLIAALRS